MPITCKTKTTRCTYTKTKGYTIPKTRCKTRQVKMVREDVPNRLDE